MDIKAFLGFELVFKSLGLVSWAHQNILPLLSGRGFFREAAPRPPRVIVSGGGSIELGFASTIGEKARPRAQATFHFLSHRTWIFLPGCHKTKRLKTIQPKGTQLSSESLEKWGVLFPYSFQIQRPSCHCEVLAGVGPKQSRRKAIKTGLGNFKQWTWEKSNQDWIWNFGNGDHQKLPG